MPSFNDPPWWCFVRVDQQEPFTTLRLEREKLSVGLGAEEDEEMANVMDTKGNFVAVFECNVDYTFATLLFVGHRNW